MYQKHLHPHFRRRKPHHAGSTFSPPQIAALYDFPTVVTGEGQTVAVIELGGGYSQSDLDKYFGNLGLTVKPVKFVSVQGAPNAGPGDDANAEVMLDLCVIGGIAPGVQLACYMAPNTTSGFAWAIEQATKDGVNVISISWGGPENSWSSADMAIMDGAIAAALAAGIAVTVAAGDNGSSDGESGHHVDFPGSSPHSICCGGTSLKASGNKISSEVVWNDGTQGGATGGGVSVVYKRPSWQPAGNIPGGGKMRAVPDFAGNADPDTGWNIVVDGQNTVVGGTSAVAPLYAALIALLNQATGKSIVADPTMYPLAAKAFRDITKGDNGVYVAVKGFDCCTGNGVAIGAKLLAALQA